MTHMVIFRNPAGKPGYHQSEGLDEAMQFAEMLRNQEQVTDARIFRMDEVPIEFKMYYRVEMAADSPAADSPAADSPAADSPAAGGVDEAPNATADGDGAPASDTTSEPAESAPGDDEARASGRHSLFSRS